MSIWVCESCMRLTSSAVCEHCGKTAEIFETRPGRLLPEYELYNKRYRVGRVLGSGGFGITYRALDLRTNRIVAVKEYFPNMLVRRDGPFDVTALPGNEKRFAEGRDKVRREYDTLMRFNNLECVVHAYDAFFENNTAYIVMEYVDGEHLGKIVQRDGKLEPGKFFAAMRPLLTSLDSIHREGMLHRDISPTNIMMRPDGSLTLLDFGSARPTPRNDEEKRTVFVHHGYAPPELYQSKGQGVYSDIYSVCATIYFAITGKEPPNSLTRKVDDPLVPPSKLGVKLPSECEKALLRGMNIAIDRRFASMRELINALYAAPMAESGGRKARRDKKKPEPPVPQFAPQTPYAPPPQAPQPPYAQSQRQAAPPKQPVAPPKQPVAPPPQSPPEQMPEVGRRALYTRIIAARRAIVFMKKFRPGKYRPKLEMIDYINTKMSYGDEKWRDVEIIINSSGKLFYIITALCTPKI